MVTSRTTWTIYPVPFHQVLNHSIMTDPSKPMVHMCRCLRKMVEGPHYEVDVSMDSPFSLAAEFWAASSVRAASCNRRKVLEKTIESFKFVEMILKVQI